jgi:hypothetical protein
MGYILLPHPEGDRRIDITLALVGRLEEKENILQAAERLVEKQMKTAEAVALLKAAYGEGAPTEDFILAHAPMAQLATLLAAIIAPLNTLGATNAGKPAGGAG